MKQKKLLALGMATLMAMSSTVMAFADDVTTEDTANGSVSGEGTLEGFVEKEVFTVTLPTTNTFDFKLDPQELLLATGSTANLDETALSEGYGSKVLFVDNTDYTSTSADITVVNKSTFDVDVSVSAKLTGLTAEGENGYDVKVLDPTDVADGDTFAFGDETAITMALTPSSNTLQGTTEGTATAGTATYLTADENGITLTETVAVSDNVDDAYEVKGTTGSYSYGLKADYSSVAFNEVVFNLSGTVNTEADWTNFSKAADAKLGVEVTYSVSKHVDSYADVTAISSSARAVTVALPDGVTISAVTLNKAAGTTVALKASTHYTKSGNTLTFESSMVSSNAGNSITITYSDGHADVINIK